MEIYVVKIADISEEMFDRLCLLIDIEKKCRIEKFLQKKDKLRTLIAEILLRTIIIEKLSISNKHIIFGKNQYGKPYLAGHPNFQFNISHSGDFVVCAIDSEPIGIDTEQIKSIEYEEIAKRFFSASEFDYITKGDIGNQLSKFYEIWTLKESYVKCCGKGLSMPLNSFSIDIDQYGHIKVPGNNEYALKSFDIEPEYKMSICSLNKEIANGIITLEQNCLIKSYFKLVLESGELY